MKTKIAVILLVSVIFLSGCNAPLSTQTNGGEPQPVVEELSCLFEGAPCITNSECCSEKCEDICVA